MAKLEFRESKYRKFMEMVSEHMGGCATGLDRGNRMVWIKLCGRKVWLDVRFMKHYENRYYGGSKFMTFGVRWIRVLRIGEVDIDFDFYAYDVNIPFEDYIHEKSRLHQFLMLLKGMAGADLKV